MHRLPAADPKRAPTPREGRDGAITPKPAGGLQVHGKPAAADVAAKAKRAPR